MTALSYLYNEMVKKRDIGRRGLKFRNLALIATECRIGRKFYK